MWVRSRISERRKAALTQEEINNIKADLLGHGYIFQDVIGRGGYASIVTARHEQYPDIFAIKVFRADMKTEKSFGAEVSSLSRLNHSNIVKIYEHFSTSLFHFLVMKYYSNGNLKDIIASGTDVDFPSTAYKILSAIRFCHERGIAHLDIKPANILMNEHTLVLSDFGLAAEVGRGGKKLTRFSGSKPYSAPEVIQGMKYDPMKADVWSAGVTLYYILARKIPWKSSQPRMRNHEICAGLIEYPSGADSRFVELIRSMLNVEPSKRPSVEKLLANDIFIDACKKTTPKPPIKVTVSLGNISFVRRVPGVASQRQQMVRIMIPEWQRRCAERLQQSVPL